MASAMYRLGVAAVMNAEIDLNGAADINVIFLRTSAYTVSQAHDFFDDLVSPVGNAGAASRTDGGALTNITHTASAGVAGTFDADNETLTSVTTGDPLTALAIYKSDTNNASSELIAYVDGFTVTPNSGDITIAWDTGTNGIFRLVA